MNPINSKKDIDNGLKNWYISTGSNVTAIILMLIKSIFVINFIGRESNGVILFVKKIAEYLFVIESSILTVVILRATSYFYKENIDKFLKAINLQRWIILITNSGYMFFSSIVVGISFYFHYSYTWTGILFLLVMFISLAQNWINVILQPYLTIAQLSQKSSKVSWVPVVFNSFSQLMAIFIIMWTRQVVIVVVFEFFISMIIFFITKIVVRKIVDKKYLSWKGTGKLKVDRKFVVDSFYFFISKSAATINQTIDHIVLLVFALDFKLISTYEIINVGTTFLVNLIFSFFDSFTDFITKITKKGMYEARDKILKSFSIVVSFLLCFALFSALMFVEPSFYYLGIIGKASENAGLNSGIIIMSLVLSTNINRYINFMLIIHKKDYKGVGKISIVYTLINLVLTFALGYHFKITGVLTATLITVTLNSFFVSRLIKDVKLIKDIIVIPIVIFILVTTVTSLIKIYFIHDYYFIKDFFGFITYGIGISIIATIFSIIVTYLISWKNMKSNFSFIREFISGKL